MPPSKRKLAGAATGTKARAKAPAPKKTIEKKKAKAPVLTSGFWLHLQARDGSEATSTHATMFEVVDHVWRWAKTHYLCLLSEWSVVHPRYGWQDAANVMITREDFVGSDDELRNFWSTFFVNSMQRVKKFEGKGEGAKICCYTNANTKPFWHKA